LIYIAYLMFRSSLGDHPSIRTYASVYGIIGFVDVPIVWMSIHWWRTIHPRVITPEKVHLHPKMWTAVLICFAATLILYAVLMRLRMSLEVMKEQVDSLRERILEAHS